MVRLQTIRVWALPYHFFEARDDAERFAMLANVTSDSVNRDSLRLPPPMPILEQVIAVATCSLVAVPLVLPLALSALCIAGCWTALAALLVLVGLSMLHRISHALAYRRNRLGLVWAKYFGFEIIIDRDQSLQAKVAATAAALDASQPEGGTTNPGGVGVVNLACPHGVVNYGASIYTFFSRWLTGADQLTAVADAVTRAPGLRHFAAPLWPVSASSSSLGRLLARGAVVGIVPDGIGGIFTAASGAVPWGKDALALGRKRGLMRLALRHGATCMPGYFVGTLQLYTISHDRFGILAALSRRLRLSLFLFHGRFGLPIPRRGPLTAVVAFAPAPSGPLAEPTAEQIEAHHARVYGALAAAYDAAKPAMGLPAAATLTIT